MHVTTLPVAIPADAAPLVLTWARQQGELGGIAAREMLGRMLAPDGGPLAITWTFRDDVVADLAARHGARTRAFGEALAAALLDEVREGLQ